MINDMLIGPAVSDGCKIVHNYIDFLKNELPEQVEDVPSAARIAMYFQHDGARFCYTRPLVQALNDTFHDQWISRGSTINLPPRSRDLTPLHLCLWVWMKNKAYRREADTRDELLAHMPVEQSQDALRRGTRHVLTQVAEHKNVEGGIFENIL
jgi:hypothetical protein